MVLIAFSLQDQVEKYGVYVGIAAFFGLALLSLLYFAQAREVKRLREWAGRAPERAAELEQAVAAHAEDVRRAPVTPVPQPQPAATNGTVKLKPEEVAALAFARAAGVHEPHEPKAHPAPVAAAVAAPPTEVAAQPLNGGNGGPTRTVPAPATPAARQAESPPPLPPRRAGGAPGRRPMAPPPRRESNLLAVVLIGVAGVLALAAVVFLFTRSDGNDEPTPPPRVSTATPEARATAAPTQAPAPTKETALVAVYNGTPQTGLAAQQSELLQQDGFPKDNLGTDNTPPEQQSQTSAVMFRRGSKAVASQVAETLGITVIKQFDDATQALIANTQKKWDVVVIVGADKMS